MVTYLLPIFGTILGYLFLGERLNGTFCLAALLILGGVFVVNLKPKSVTSEELSLSRPDTDVDAA